MAERINAMALRWNFAKKAGTVTQIYDGKEYTSNFYEGNALMIVCNEFEENGVEKYNVIWFFLAKDHAERCLGLAKSDDGTKHNMFKTDGYVTRLTVYPDHLRKWQTIVDLFMKAFPDIEITIRNSSEDQQNV